MENKIDSSLILALETSNAGGFDNELYLGYDKNSNKWKLLIRYIEDISDLVKLYNIDIIYLLNEFAIINIDSGAIEALSSDPRIIYIDKARYLYSQVSFAEYSSCITDDIKAYRGLDGTGVAIAIIDSGIDIHHSEFMNEYGSRILYYFDITKEYDETFPNEYGIGRIYNKNEINNAISDNLIVAPDTSGHGTGVAAIACGSNIGIANNSYILAVKISADYNEANTFDLVLGIDFCIRFSRRESIPLIINISYGNNYGSHKGDSMLENYIDATMKLTKCNIICGTGNEGFSRKHFEHNLINKDFLTVETVIGEGITSFNIQIWKSFQDIFDIAIISPSGDNVMYISEIQGYESIIYNNVIIRGIYSVPNPYTTNQEIFFEFSSKTTIPKGIWKISIICRKISNGKIYGYLSGNSDTYFIDAYDFGTLTIPSTSKGVISVAAYNQNYKDYAYFSGRGYEIGGEIKPDLAAPGVDIFTANNNGYQIVSGTSIATPFVSGSAALLMQWGIVMGNDLFLYGEKLKAKIIRGCKPLNTNLTTPNPYIGWGTLCLKDSFDK